MFLKILILFIFDFLTEIGPGHAQTPSTLGPTTTGIFTQNCTQFSTSRVDWFGFTSSSDPNCYYLSSQYQKGNWFEANDECRKLNSSVASIHDNTTNYLLAHHNTSDPDDSYESAIFWIGLNSQTKRGVYQWSDLSPVQFYNFTNVTSSGDPIPISIFDQGRCVSFKSMTKNDIRSRKYQGGWFKDDCNSQFRYICQRSSSVGPVSTPAPTPVGNCPSDWFQYANQKCVKYMNVSMTFNQSRDLCLKTNGADILSIHSEEEQNFVTAYTAGLPSPLIGMIMVVKNPYNWVWENNKRIDYTNWGVPKSLEDDYGKNCASIITNETQPGKWIKTNCSERHSVVCEKPLDPAITTPGQTYMTDKCEIPGFENFTQYRNSCYSVHDSVASYYAAEGNCQSMNNSHLVSIEDPFEEAFLRYFIKQYGKSDEYWIGLQSDAVTNVSQMFEWTDSWPVYYTNWDRDEPQFAGVTQAECVHFLKSNGTWRTTICDTGLGYVCKITSNPLPKMNSNKSGVCPSLKNVTDKSMQWVNIDKRSQYCYWFSYQLNDLGKESWIDASFHCRQRNGTLVSIHSKHDLMLLKNKFTISQASNNTWIGLSTDPKGDYLWEDGSALEYTNWDPNEQIVTSDDLNKIGSNRQCVEVMSDWMWKQQPCSGTTRNYYICEVKKIYHAQVPTQFPGQTTHLPGTTNKNPIQGSAETSYPNSSQTTTPGQNKRTTQQPDQSSTVPILKKEHSSKKGMSGGAKAGISFGIMGGIVLVLAIVYFALKRFRPNSPAISTFENDLYSSRRRINPKSEPSARF